MEDLDKELGELFRNSDYAKSVALNCAKHAEACYKQTAHLFAFEVDEEKDKENIAFIRESFLAAAQFSYGQGASVGAGDVLGMLEWCANKDLDIGSSIDLMHKVLTEGANQQKQEDD